MYKLFLADKYLNLKINTSKNQPYKKSNKKIFSTKIPKIYMYSYSSNSYYLANLDNNKNIFRKNRDFKIDFRFNHNKYKTFSL